MPPLNIASHRLRNHYLVGAAFNEPSEVVGWLGAMQAQDYLGALWGIGLRMADATEGTIARAVDEGTILRTHLMRPTWHFVTPTDLRWILALTAPRTHAGNAYMYRKLDLDDALLARTDTLLAEALRGGKHLTRTELAAMLRRVGIVANALRLGYIMMHAELNALICSGARRGKQFTYALLDERVPPVPPVERDAALAELTQRYFTSHGPATVQDFAWWSGLTTADAKRGLEIVSPAIIQETVDDQTFWFAPSTPPPSSPSVPAHLLPNYDEYTISYKDYSALIDTQRATLASTRKDGVFWNTVVVGGLIVGTWRRTLNKREVIVELNPAVRLTAADNQAIAEAADRYAAFLGLSAVLS